MARDALIYDWNDVEAPAAPRRPLEFFDETLRDGLQSPSVRRPDLDTQIQLLRLMVELGIGCANIGFPGAGPEVYRDVLALGRVIRDERLAMRPTCVGRTAVADLEPIVRASDELGLPIEAACFIGSSEIRRMIESWDLDVMLRHTETAVRFAVDRGMSVMFVTEDTTRAHPETLTRLYRTAIECGARRICACDTVGHSTPAGAARLVRFLRALVADSGEAVVVDWHGHNDRGLGLANALAAVEAGADRIEAAGLGIGERCGNTAMDQLLLNLKLMGVIDNDLSRLADYCRLISDAVGLPIPVNYPAVGADAFRTASGVHAAAIHKAMELGDLWLANRVYSGVPAEEFGAHQQIEIGPMSGRSNVLFWLRSRGLAAGAEAVDRVLEAAKRSAVTLSEAQIRGLVGEGDHA